MPMTLYYLFTINKLRSEYVAKTLGKSVFSLKEETAHMFPYKPKLDSLTLKHTLAEFTTHRGFPTLTLLVLVTHSSLLQISANISGSI